MKTTLLLCIVLLSGFSFGQVIETLEKNNASIKASADGHLFYDPTTTMAGYEIPKGSGLNAIFCQNLWLGSLDANAQLRIAAQRFGGDSTDFFPGPYSSNGSYNDPNYISGFLPAIWRVTQADIDAHIAEFNSNGSVSNPHPSILNWPAHGDLSLGMAADLAPFFDVNLDGNYDPFGGDFPAIKGCEALYVIMNDSKTAAGGTGTPSLDVEIHILLYQYASLDYLNDVTFMDIRVINRGSIDLLDFHFGTFTDADLGNSTDDYVGSDPVRNVIYTYNGDFIDEPFAGSQGYGASAPAIGVMYLNQPMTYAGYFTGQGSFDYSDPQTASEYWNYLNGKWRLGADWLYGGQGYTGSLGVTTIPTTHMFPGVNDPLLTATGGIDPGFEWDELTNNNPLGDRRMICSSELGTLSAGAEIEIYQAIIYGRDLTLNSFENVNVMLSIADSVQVFHDAGMDVCKDPFASILPVQAEMFSIYPNPANGEFTIDVPTVSAGLTVDIVDVFGKLVHSEEIAKTQTHIELNEAPGIYFVKLSGNGINSTVKLILD